MVARLAGLSPHRSLACLALVASLGLPQRAAAASRAEQPSAAAHLVLAPAGSVDLPFGRLAWSGPEVRAGEPGQTEWASAEAQLPPGEWSIDLRPTGDNRRHALTLELAPGITARPGATYGEARLEGWRSRPIRLELSLEGSASQATVLALAMGDRVYIELPRAAADRTLVLSVSPAGTLGEATNGGPGPGAFTTLACGGGGPCRGYVQVSGGYFHTVALTAGGELRAWGSNLHGQLGDGTTIERGLPVAVQQAGGGPLTGIAAVSAGNDYTVAVTNRGEVLAWGNNAEGQLGDGTTTDRLLPVAVERVGGGGPLNGIAAVAAAYAHTLALTTTGQVRAWGQNQYGQLGNWTQLASSRPVVVQQVGGGGPLAGIVAVAAGSEHSVALTTTGEVRAWGRNLFGALGDGSTNDRNLPGVVQQPAGGAPLDGIAAIAAGAAHTLSLTTAGEVRAWGHNRQGELGDGTSTDRWLPVVVQQVGGGPLAGITAIAAGGAHSVALTTGGELRAWGSNLDGRLGDGTLVDRALPVVVQQVGGGGALGGIAAIAAGCRHTLAWTAGGELRAWGDNSLNQLGDGTTRWSAVPTCPRPAERDPALPAFAQVAAGTWHTVALTVAGEVRAWGENRDGQLGDGTWTDRPHPVVVQRVGGGGPLRNIAAVAAGGSHSLALTTTGDALAWGDGTYGQIGNGPPMDFNLPVAVQGVGGGGRLQGIAAIAGGEGHSVALTIAGETLAWGNNTYGQIGDGTNAQRTVPTVVQQVGGGGPLAGITAVAAGHFHTVALTAGGEVRAWGRNGEGRLGDGTTVDSNLPVVVQQVGGGGPLAGITAVAAGTGHTVALTSAGEVRAWGDNAFGQLGDGTTTDRLLPVAVERVGGGGPLAGIAAVAAGASHTLALTSAGEVRAWGTNGAGQLGDGTTTASPLPVVVQAVGGGGPLGRIAAISLFGSHSFAATLTGELHGWGTDSYGQLGDGHLLENPLPLVALCPDPAAPGAELLRNDQTTGLDRSSPALASIFTGTGADSLDRLGPDGVGNVGEGATLGEESLPGSADDDDLYRAGVVPPWSEPDPAVVADGRRPLVFYQLAGAAGPIRLVKRGASLEVHW